MGLETITYVSDFNISNPTADDPRAQGDDHLRGVKTGMKNSFPVDLRDVAATTAGQILLINSSGRPQNQTIGFTRITDTSLAVNNSTFTDFSGNTENNDDLGLWAAGNPTRFTLPATDMHLMFSVLAAYSGHLAGGTDILEVQTSINSSATNTYEIPIVHTSGNTAALLIPWFGGTTADFLEIGFRLRAVETADTAITLSNVEVSTWRHF